MTKPLFTLLVTYLLVLTLAATASTVPGGARRKPKPVTCRELIAAIEGNRQNFAAFLQGYGVDTIKLHRHLKTVFNSMIGAVGHGSSHPLELTHLVKDPMVMVAKNDGVNRWELLRNYCIKGLEYLALRQKGFAKVSAAKELVISTHQLPHAQKAMLALPTSAPYLFLIDPTSKNHVIAELAPRVAVSWPSLAGDFMIPLEAIEKVHLVGQLSKLGVTLLDVIVESADYGSGDQPVVIEFSLKHTFNDTMVFLDSLDDEDLLVELRGFVTDLLAVDRTATGLRQADTARLTLRNMGVNLVTENGKKYRLEFVR